VVIGPVLVSLYGPSIYKDVISKISSFVMRMRIQTNPFAGLAAAIWAVGFRSPLD
jgi:hypothetical protein